MKMLQRLSLLAAGAVFLAAPLPAEPAPAHKPAIVTARLSSRTSTIPTAPDGRRGYIVVLSDPPLAQSLKPATRVTPHTTVKSLMAERSPQFEQAKALLLSRHAAIIRKLSAEIPHLSVGAHYTNVLNGFAVLIAPGDVNKLRTAPGVRAVYPIRHYTLTLDTSNPLMNAPAMWTALGGDSNAGAGTKIGMLDTGIDFSNPMFSDSSLSMPAGFPKENDGNHFANSKVIVADYFQSIFDAEDPGLSPQHRSAQDFLGHGSHSSSCAAGAKVNLTAVSQRDVALEGVAPKAYIGDYKVFAPNDNTDNEIAAIDQAVADGMDVLNMSFGLNNPDGTEPNIYNQDPELEAIDNAIQAGLVICVSAGNSGPVTGSIGSPANIPGVISVGASTNTHDGVTDSSLALVTVTGPGAPSNLQNIPAAQGVANSPVFPASGVAAAPFADVTAKDPTGLGCAPLPAASFSGETVLIQRGTCPFADKVSNAANAGAVAVVIADNKSEAIFPPYIDCSAASNPATCANLPTAFVAQSDGLNIKSYIDAHTGPPPAGQVAIAPGNNIPPVVTSGIAPHDLASFSSIGPTIDFQIKPDLLSVGTGSYAACQAQSALGEARFNDDYTDTEAIYDPSGFTFSQGTSFSAPRAAGSAALVIQQHPSWSPAEVKAALMETASRQYSGVVNDQQSIDTLPLMQIGSGEIDLGAASAVKSLVLPPSYSFRRLAIDNVGNAAPIQAVFTLENKSSGSVTYALSALANPFYSDPAVAPSVSPANLTVAAGQSGQFTLTLSVATTVAPGENSSEGAILVTDNGTTIPVQLYIPYWILIAHNAGSAPVVDSLQESIDATDKTSVNLTAKFHDADGDLNGLSLNYYDNQGNFFQNQSGTFQDLIGQDLTGQTNVTFQLQISGLLASDNCPNCAAVSFQVVDAQGNLSNTSYASFLQAPAVAIPSSSAAYQTTLPLVAHSQGTFFFQSDARLFNPSSSDYMFADAYFTPQGESGAGPLLQALHTTIPVAPRQSFALDDLVLDSFGLSNGIGSLTLLSTDENGSPIPLIANERAYTRQGGGTFGTSAPAQTPPQAIGIADGTTWANGFPTATGFHTNVGATEVTGQTTVVKIVGFGAGGNVVGSFDMTMAPYSNLQVNNPAAAGMFTAPPALICYQVTSGGKVIAYATSVDEGSGDTSLSLAVPTPASSGDLIIAQTAHTAGANNTFFTSNFALSNTGITPATVQLSLLPDFLGGTPTTPAPVTIGPRSTFLAPDVLAAEFGLGTGNSGSGIRIHPAGPSSLVASAKTTTPNPNGSGSYGFFLNDENSSAALSAGHAAVSIQVEQDTLYRTNFGFTEISGQPVTVRATVYDDQGVPLGTRAFPVAASSTSQFPISAIISDTSVANGYIEFTIDSGAGSVLPFVAEVDNITGDAIAVPGVLEY